MMSATSDPTDHDYSDSIHSPLDEGEPKVRAIGELIRDARNLSAEDVERISKYQREHKMRFGEAAIALGLANAEDVLFALSQQFQYAYGDEERRRANPELVALSKRNAAVQRVSDKATFIRGDLFETDLSNATVITLFLRLDLNLKLRPTLLDLEPGTRVVSNTFSMGDWEPDDIVIGGRDCANCSAMMWIIPARVQGNWRLPQGDMTLTQTFQDVTGTLRTGRASLPISEGRLRADRITFTAGGVRYSGRVSEGKIEGTATTDGNSVRWTATRNAAAR